MRPNSNDTHAPSLSMELFPEYIQRRHSQTGWPWNEESKPADAVMANGKPWPKISIITPSFNQGEFIEETIRSVLLQGYPNLEYIIVDGGSTDQTVQIIKKYEPWISSWVSEPDHGQTHALNKGFQKATGEIVAWMNSDDYYAKGAFQCIAQVFVDHEKPLLLYGDCNEVNEDGVLTKHYSSPYEGVNSLVIQKGFIPQPASFFHKQLIEEVGYLDESLRYAMDCDLWIKIAQSHDVLHIKQTLANFRIHSASKTEMDLPKMLAEHEAVVRKYWGSRLNLKYHTQCFQARRQRSYVYLSFANRALAEQMPEVLPLLLRSLLTYPLIVFNRSFLSVCVRYMKKIFSALITTK